CVICGQIETGNRFPEYYILKVNNFDAVAKTPLDESFLRRLLQHIQMQSVANRLKKRINP
ncbi:MAG: hypothetical protein LBI60_00480, partial [Bacteroidales bacterium]|nr:hypothetical protein [Bacteroidales bacterium]